MTRYQGPRTAEGASAGFAVSRFGARHQLDHGRAVGPSTPRSRTYSAGRLAQLERHAHIPRSSERSWRSLVGHTSTVCRGERSQAGLAPLPSSRPGRPVTRSSAGQRFVRCGQGVSNCPATPLDRLGRRRTDHDAPFMVTAGLAPPSAGHSDRQRPGSEPPTLVRTAAKVSYALQDALGPM